MKIYKCNFEGNYTEDSLISYHITEFSDSQKQIAINPEYCNNSTNFVKIISRMDWKDLQDITLAVKALRRLHINNIYLEVPYFLGARSDRLFTKGSTHYLKDIICPLINSLEFKEVSILDPHSLVLESCLNNYKEMSRISFYDWFIETSIVTSEDKQNTFIIAPDYGAEKRARLFTQEYNFENIVFCSKVRNTDTGKILGVNIPIDNFNNKSCIIIDDICDGGATFVELAKQLRKKSCGKITLLVTHTIHKNGVINVLKEVDKLYTTNSVADINFLWEEKESLNFFQYKVI